MSWQSPPKSTRRQFLQASGGLASALILAGASGRSSAAEEGGGETPAAAPAAKPNVVVIVLDSLRADHVGAYGYGRPTTPFLDLLAREGLVFEQVLAQSSYTRQSVPSILTGRNPSECGAFGWTAAPQRGVNLGRSFKDAGYRTGMFTNTAMLEDAAYHDGFDTFRNVNVVWNESGTGPVLSATAGAFAAAEESAPFFMYVHYLDPHGPYLPPRAFYARFADSINPEPLNINRALRIGLPDLRAAGFGPGERQFEDLVSRYDAEIAHSDYAVGQLFDTLEQAGRLDNTIVAIVSDHGEEFLEHGFIEHAWMLFQEHLRVPLILWAPGRLRPGRHTGTVPLMALAPTLAALAGLDATESGYSAGALLERQADAWAVRPHTGPILSELTVQSRNIVRTITDGPWKYMAAQRWIPPETLPSFVRQSGGAEADESKIDQQLDVFGPIVHEALYNLEEDPAEQINLAKSEGAMRDRYHAQMLAYYAACKRLNPAGANTQPEIMSEEERERLESMGYLK